MFGIKLFGKEEEKVTEVVEAKLTKEDFVAVLSAAGLSFQDAYSKAISNLETTVAVQQGRIDSNTETIIKAEAAIEEATSVLDKTNATLSIVRRLA